MTEPLFTLLRLEPGKSTMDAPRELQILLVEDDPDIARLVMLHLEDLNAATTHCARGDLGLEQARSGSWDIMILDLRLPGLNGLEVCRELRGGGDHTPIVMLTSKSSELDRVLGLELGADDYLTKPFSPLELVARVKAVLRRVDQSRRADSATAEAADDLIHCGKLKIDTRRHSVCCDGSDVELTAREFDLLLHFVRHPGEVFRRSELLDQVWGYGHDGYEHTVNSHINRLRAKIEPDPAHPASIITVWGVGYKFQDCGAAQAAASGAALL